MPLIRTVVLQKKTFSKEAENDINADLIEILDSV
jgi:hypothetical protein